MVSAQHLARFQAGLRILHFEPVNLDFGARELQQHCRDSKEFAIWRSGGRSSESVLGNRKTFGQIVLFSSSQFFFDPFFSSIFCSFFFFFLFAFLSLASLFLSCLYFSLFAFISLAWLFLFPNLPILICDLLFISPCVCVSPAEIKKKEVEKKDMTRPKNKMDRAVWSGKRHFGVQKKSSPR